MSEGAVLPQYLVPGESSPKWTWGWGSHHQRLLVVGNKLLLFTLQDPSKPLLTQPTTSLLLPTIIPLQTWLLPYRLPVTVPHVLSSKLPLMPVRTFFTCILYLTILLKSPLWALVSPNGLAAVRLLDQCNWCQPCQPTLTNFLFPPLYDVPSSTLLLYQGYRLLGAGITFLFCTCTVPPQQHPLILRACNIIFE